MSELTNWLLSLTTLTFSAALTGAVTYFASTGALPPNGFIGIRVGRIDRSEEVWQRAHRKALPFMLAASSVALLSVIASVIVMGDPEKRITCIVWGFFALLGVGMIAALIAFLDARKPAITDEECATIVDDVGGTEDDRSGHEVQRNDDASDA
ncbi:SdpI family protein [Leucobacter sp. UCMA 4100]|uniref:SdpI family protein n=1 Tax=Leucobacter sp. UCMA 4100 TaxID=2810534 RepID=UPI0022EB9C0E|nr:SdpI family protein [Leucobacter sp. UCMA 4100]MDA3146480.1 SdpI family protein [Leucobacter sp. UCMA 4100]